MSDFKPGLEGVVAVETEIAEPDREGGSLRYRGVDIEELVGHYSYESVWGLLVDDDLESKMPDPEPYEPAGLTGNAPADLQAETARLAGDWKLGKLNEISDGQAREDLGRLSAQMMSIVARSARRSRAASGSWASDTASTAPRTRALASSSGRRRSSARRTSRSRRSSSGPRSPRSRSGTPSACSRRTSSTTPRSSWTLPTSR